MAVDTKQIVRVQESVVPGLGHIRRGYRAAGIRFLVYFIAWWLVAVFRHAAILRVVTGGGFDAVLTVVIMLGMPVLLVKWAHSSLKMHVAPPPRSGLGTWQLAWRDLRRNPRALWGITLLGLFYLSSFLAPVLAPFDPNEPGGGGEIVHRLRAPGTHVILVGHPDGREVAANRIEVVGEHAVLRRKNLSVDQLVKIADMGEPARGWSRGADTVKTAEAGEATFPYRTERYLLGTDAQGRDLLSRLLYGSRISLFIGFLAMFVAVTLGILFGSLAGYFGGWVDTGIMRFVDILLAFPRLLLLLLIVSVWEGAGILVVVVVLGLTGWMGVSRLVRAEFLRVKELDYSAAAKSLGYSRPRIMFRHLLPNCMAPVIVNATLLVGNTILVEAALSFLGFGVKPPDPSWGNIISDGEAYLDQAWWISTIPGLLIVFAVVCFNMVGDALRDALDPKGRS